MPMIQLVNNLGNFLVEKTRNKLRAKAAKELAINWPSVGDSKTYHARMNYYRANKVLFRGG